MNTNRDEIDYDKLLDAVADKIYEKQAILNKKIEELKLKNEENHRKIDFYDKTKYENKMLLVEIANNENIIDKCESEINGMFLTLSLITFFEKKAKYKGFIK